MSRIDERFALQPAADPVNLSMVNTGCWVKTCDRMPPVGELVYVRGGPCNTVRAYVWTSRWWTSMVSTDNDTISEWFEMNEPQAVDPELVAEFGEYHARMMSRLENSSTTTPTTAAVEGETR